MAVTKNSKVVAEVEAILNSALGVREKLAALKAVNTEGRPGANQARELIADYRSKIQAKRDALRANVHSADAPRRRNLTDRFAAFFPSLLRQTLTRDELSELPETRAAFDSPSLGWFGTKSFARCINKTWKGNSAASGTNAQITKQQAKRAFELREIARERDKGLAEVRAAFGFYDNTFKTVPLAALLNEYAGGSSSVVARVGEWLVRSNEDEETDWNAYSKAWHRAHGPKRTITNRRVEIRRVSESGEVERRDVALDGFRGNWLLNSLVEAGVVEARKIPTRLRSVQLHEAFEVERVRQIGEVEIYRRTLAGDAYDFCAVWHGLTFHAATTREALKGLRGKLAEAERAEHAAINFKLARTLGFCEDGIRQFCRDFDLDIKESYTPDEIRAALRANASDVGKYESELTKLAAAVGEPATL
ncbi:MAG: hypothetical protein M3416_01460 [Acidobacteriota bacterium]|nr:hypothetical protein [Acidobacteriota bacterium]